MKTNSTPVRISVFSLVVSVPTCNHGLSTSCPKQLDCFITINKRGNYHPVGGKVEARDATAERALIRELNEEFGLRSCDIESINQIGDRQVTYPDGTMWYEMYFITWLSPRGKFWMDGVARASKAGFDLPLAGMAKTRVMSIDQMLASSGTDAVSGAFDGIIDHALTGLGCAGKCRRCASNE